MKEKTVFNVIAVFVATISGWHFYSNSKKIAKVFADTVVTASRGDIEQLIISQGKLEPKKYVFPVIPSSFIPSWLLSEHSQDSLYSWTSKKRGGGPESCETSDIQGLKDYLEAVS